MEELSEEIGGPGNLQASVGGAWLLVDEEMEEEEIPVR